jgi:hypothetical protein
VGRKGGKQIQVRDVYDAERIIGIISLLDPAGVDAGSYYIDADVKRADEPRYVILSDFEDAEDGVLYWSNEDGWGSRSTATVFTEAERDDVRMPLEAAGWMRVNNDWARLHNDEEMEA